MKRILLLLAALVSASPAFTQSAPLILKNGRVAQGGTADTLSSTGGPAVLPSGVKVPNSVSNVAALRTNNAISAPVFVRGYYSDGDLGAGVFIYVASDTTGTDNGGTVIVDASNRRWHRYNPTNILTPQLFGAKCDNSTDDTLKLQNMVAAANNTVGNHVLFPAGQCVINGSMNIAQPALIEGVGGQANNTGAVASVVQCSATADTFYVTTSQAVVFRNLGIRDCGGRTAGLDIHIHGDGTNQPIGDVFDNISFSGSWTAIGIENGDHWSVTNCLFSNYLNDAIYYPNNSYPDSGDNYIVGNTFATLPTSGYAALYFESALGTYVSANKFYGASFGIEINEKNTSGDLQVVGNSFEEQGISHIDIRQASGTPGVANITIVGNEFSQLTSVTPSVNPTAPSINVTAGLTASYVKNLVISANVFNSNWTGNYPAISINDGNAVLIQGNTFSFFNTAGPGAIQTASRAVAVRVLDNVFNEMTSSQHYKQGLKSDTVVRDDNLHFADVGAWGNGSQIYVVDGTPGATLAGSGTGAWGRRINGAWNGN